MTLHAGTPSPAAAACGDCGAPASGSFCSSCGADLRASSLSFLGRTAVAMRRSFPAVYLKILRAPIGETVAFAQDPSYRGYLSFALAGIALYILLIVPIVMQQVAPPGTNVSESLLTLMKILSQVGVYAGIVITFLLAFLVFRLFALVQRPFHAYFKLYAIALGFVAPIYGVYEFVARSVLGGVGTSSINLQLTQQALLTPTGLSSLVLVIAIFCYYIGIHRKFWEMPVWKAAPLYLVTSVASNVIGFYVMWWVGFYVARVLIDAGVVTP